MHTCVNWYFGSPGYSRTLATVNPFHYYQIDNSDYSDYYYQNEEMMLAVQMDTRYRFRRGINPRGARPHPWQIARGMQVVAEI